MDPLFTPFGFLSSGALVVAEPIASGNEMGSGTGIHRGTVRIRALDLDGGVEAVFGDFPGTEVSRTVSAGNVVARVVPFGRSTLVAVGRDRVYVTTGDGFEILAFDGRGRLVQVLRQTRERVAVTPEDVELWIRSMLDRITGDPELRGRLEEEYLSYPTPAC
ncbi:hypothetical protein ACFL0I_04145 [Gemmatimonadota bacterium]